jgi:hypothetical protein
MPHDHLKRSPEIAYNETIKEHEVKPGLYTLHPKQGPESCPKNQIQFLFFAILLSRDSDRAFITLLRILTRFMFWQDWRKTHLKAIMLPSDLSPLVRTLIISNWKYLLLYPVLILGDFMLTFTTLWKRMRRSKQSRSSLLTLHAKLASSRHIPTIFTYLNNWIYQKQHEDLLDFYLDPSEPPLSNGELHERYYAHNNKLTHSQKNVAYLGLILHIVTTFAIGWAFYISLHKANLFKYDMIKAEAISYICKR